MYIRLEGLFYIAGDLITLLGLWQKVCKEKRARPCQAHSSSVLPDNPVDISFRIQIFIGRGLVMFSIRPLTSKTKTNTETEKRTSVTIVE